MSETYEVFFIVMKGRDGKARGIEKVWNEVIFYDREEAERVFSGLPDFIKNSYKIVCAHVSYVEE